MSKNIIDTDKLKTPVKGIEDISFLGNKLIIIVRNSDEIEKLVYAWISFFQVLCRDKNAS